MPWRVVPMIKPDEMPPIDPCPFCGGEGRIIYAPESWVQCTECGAAGPMHSRHLLAVTDWNRRAAL